MREVPGSIPGTALCTNGIGRSAVRLALSVSKRASLRALAGAHAMQRLRLAPARGLLHELSLGFLGLKAGAIVLGQAACDFFVRQSAKGGADYMCILRDRELNPGLPRDRRKY